MTTTTTAFDGLVDDLRDHGSTVTVNGDKATAQCPAHDDHHASLSIGPRRDGKGVVVFCQAGCPTTDVVAALDKTMSDLFDDPRMRAAYNGHNVYDYPDGRKVHRKPGKKFRQSENTEGTALFHADLIGDAETVYVVEGEKDVLAAEAVGAPAVCSAMGAGKAHKADWSPLRGKHVIIVADKDAPGRKHTTQTAEMLDGIAASVTIKEAAVGKDLADHIAAGLSLDELVEVAQVQSLLDRLAVNGAWLDGQLFDNLEYAVDRIIPEGLGLLVGPPKKGKSFLVADIGLAVADGGEALGCIPVTQRPVLYLALEDGHRRLQNRFRRILGPGQPIPAGIEVIIKATPGEAIQAIEQFMARHTQRKPLVILDTLGKVKPPKQPGQDAYLVDYQIGTRLKNLADAVAGSTLLVVHHTRKAEAADFVDTVSGTQGIAGSVDFVLALVRERHSDDAVMNVTGRDVIEAEYALHADDGILWRLDGTDLAAAHDTVQKRRDLEKMGDRTMDVYNLVNTSSDPVTATVVATMLKDLDGDTAGKYLRRLKAKGYIIRVGRGEYLGCPTRPETDTSGPETDTDPGDSDTPDDDSDTDPGAANAVTETCRRSDNAVSEVSEVSVSGKPADQGHAEGPKFRTPPVSEVSETPQYHSPASEPLHQTDTSDTSDTDIHGHLFNEPSTNGEVFHCKCGNKLLTPDAINSGKCKPCRDKLMAGYDR